MNYLWHLVVIGSVYALLAMALNLVLGYAGLMSLCHAALFGLGAYVSTLLVLAGWSFLPALVVASAACAAIGAALAIPTVRLRGDSFVLATLAFQVIAIGLFSNWVSVTGGTFGLANIPAPSVLGVTLDSPVRYGIFAAAVAALCGLLFWRMLDSPFGRVLRAIREDEVAAIALGKDVNRVKMVAFVVSAAAAAVPGALQAGYARYIDPTSFTLNEGILVLSMVVIGGAGSLAGPWVGALITVAIPEVLRVLAIPDVVAGNLRQILYGALLVLLMRTRPRGVTGRYGFE
ncbi:MAG: branched-chain amino acid ABC transporter permease [Vicinamibacterales bacterium]